jgi:hypothetical protein
MVHNIIPSQVLSKQVKWGKTSTPCLAAPSPPRLAATYVKVQHFPAPAWDAPGGEPNAVARPHRARTPARAPPPTPFRLMLRPLNGRLDSLHQRVAGVAAVRRRDLAERRRGNRAGPRPPAEPLRRGRGRARLCKANRPARRPSDFDEPGEAVFHIWNSRSSVLLRIRRLGLLRSILCLASTSRARSRTTLILLNIT